MFIQISGNQHEKIIIFKHQHRLLYLIIQKLSTKVYLLREGILASHPDSLSRRRGVETKHRVEALVCSSWSHCLFDGVEDRGGQEQWGFSYSLRKDKGKEKACKNIEMRTCQDLALETFQIESSINWEL